MSKNATSSSHSNPSCIDVKIHTRNKAMSDPKKHLPKQNYSQNPPKLPKKPQKSIEKQTPRKISKIKSQKHQKYPKKLKSSHTSYGYPGHFIINIHTRKTATSDLENKTPGYHRDALHPPTLLKMPFRRMQAFFFKVFCFFMIISNFFKFKFFLTFAKKISKTKWKDTSEKKYHLRRIQEKIDTSNHYEKLQDNFSKKPIFSAKNPKF